MTREPGRPDPDALLAEVTRTDRPAGRGRLKIFFGFSPGVGKTYAMLESARRLRDEGCDVVAGIVESHGRAETARLLEGIEVLPRVEVPYRGHVLRELDCDGAIARRPALLLVDELAHTNAPGLRHEKRWQDIVDLLAAGIDVHTTLNVQHVEGLVDLVEQATGIRVRETVPDSVLDRADEIELVDLPPDELLERLREGKVYLPDVAARAVDRFFKRSNLLHLRELALLRMARRAGSDAEETRRGGTRRGSFAERLVVGVGTGTGSARAVRDAARIAAGLRAEWLAVHVRRPFERPPSPEEAARLENHLRLAESGGARVERVVGTSVAEGLLDEARRVDATRLVVGRPRTRSAWWPLRERVLERLVAGAGPIDVVVAGVTDLTDDPPAPPRAAAEPFDVGFRVAAIVTAVVAAVLAVGRLARPWVDDHDMSVVALLLVVAASLRFGRGAGILTVVLAAAGIDLLFVHPEFRLAVSDTKKIVSLALLLSVGIVVAELIVRMRSQREMALAAERRLGRLLELSRRLAAATNPEEVAAALARVSADVTGAGVEVVLADGAGQLHVAAREGVVPQASLGSGVMLWCHTFGQPAGRGLATFPGAGIVCLPIRESGRGRGVLVVGHEAPRALSRDESELLSSAVAQATDRLARMEPPLPPSPRSSPPA